MPLALNDLKPNKARTKTKKRVGRGNSSGVGSYSARGMKGQKARSGGKGGLKLKGMRAMVLSTPKLRGFTSLKPKNIVFSLDVLDKNFKEGDVVSRASLVEKKMIPRSTLENVKIKILGKGDINKKLEISGCLLSENARKMIEKAGGTVKK